jgi:hypothetical protein
MRNVTLASAGRLDLPIKKKSPQNCAQSRALYLDSHLPGVEFMYTSKRFARIRPGAVVALLAVLCFSMPAARAQCTAGVNVINPKFQEAPEGILLIPGGVAPNSLSRYWEQFQ